MHRKRFILLSVIIRLWKIAHSYRGCICKYTRFWFFYRSIKILLGDLLLYEVPNLFFVLFFCRTSHVFQRHLVVRPFCLTARFITKMQGQIKNPDQIGFFVKKRKDVCKKRLVSFVFKETTHTGERITQLLTMLKDCWSFIVSGPLAQGYSFRRARRCELWNKICTGVNSIKLL